MSSLRRATWRMLSREPRVFFCPDFLTPQECDVFVNIANECNRVEVRPRVLLKTDTPHLRPHETALLHAVEDRVSALSGAPIQKGETPWAVKHKLGASQQSSGDAGVWGFFGRLFGTAPRRPPTRRISKGLHLDTNYTPRRWLTFIAYLRTTPPQAGGHTVFPLASPPGQRLGSEHRQLRACAELLLGCGIDHTHFASRCRDPAISDRVGGAARALLAHAELVAAQAAAEASACAASAEAPRPMPYFHPGGLGLAVPAVQGSCAAFFTRSPDEGAIDPLTFHGGAVVSEDGVPKWTLQRFREMPEDVPMDELSDFVTRQAAMEDCAGGGVCFSVEGREAL